MLPQEFPRHLAQLRLDDVLADLPDGPARQAYQSLFDAVQQDPVAPHRLVIHQAGEGEGALRLLMALMRLTVLRLRELNLERFESQGGTGRLLSAYVRGENLALPLPERAAALFIERAERANPALAGALERWDRPLFVTWQGPAEGALWEALTRSGKQVTL